MATTLKELISQKEVLEARIEELRKTEQADAIAKVQAIMSEFGLTQKDIFARAASVKSAKIPKAKVPAKYRDTTTGNEWSGRGLQPKWLVGKNKADFLIA